MSDSSPLTTTEHKFPEEKKEHEIPSVCVFHGEKINASQEVKEKINFYLSYRNGKPEDGQEILKEEEDEKFINSLSLVLLIQLKDAAKELKFYRLLQLVLDRLLIVLPEKCVPPRASLMPDTTVEPISGPKSPNTKHLKPPKSPEEKGEAKQEAKQEEKGEGKGEEKDEEETKETGDKEMVKSCSKTHCLYCRSNGHSLMKDAYLCSQFCSDCLLRMNEGLRMMNTTEPVITVTGDSIATKPANSCPDDSEKVNRRKQAVAVLKLTAFGTTLLGIGYLFGRWRSPRQV